MKTRGLIIIIVLLVIFIFTTNVYPILGGGSNASSKEENVDLTLGNPFITNVKDSKSLIKVGITLRLNNKKAAEELEKKPGEVRDIINYILRGKTETQFRQHGIQLVLKEEIKDDINERFNFDCVEDVFFTEIVLQ